MSKKIALLIGVGAYGAGLESLRCPRNGVEAMRRVLKDPEIGSFDEVVSLVDPGVGELRSRICEVFAGLTRQDLILFYFTGHGLKDMTGDFYLTTSETQLFANGRPNAGTAIEADFLKREISHSLAERKVVVLDCCFGAAFADGFLTMGSDRTAIEDRLGGKGWCLLTASTSSRYALEQVGEPLSIYTRYLVKGLKSGAAAEGARSRITARMWHEYAKRHVEAVSPAMEPAIFSGQQGYDIAIAKVKKNGAQQYRQQVERRVREGAIGPAARAVLNQWQQHCGLSLEQAKAIEDTVLLPYQKVQQKVSAYAQAIEAEKGVAYPLRSSSVQDLKDLQRLLDICDDEAVAIERRILGHGLYGEISSHADVQLLAKSASRAGDRSIKRQCYLFKFETLKVDEKGDRCETIRRTATAFAESLGRGVLLEMVRIPAGSFVMGAARDEAGADEDEYPQQSLAVPEFWMGKYTITQAQWQRFVAERGGRVAEGLNEDAQSMAVKKPDFPINTIYWPEAVEFCHWLSQHSGRDYRLPSQVQWEYACRAGAIAPFYFGQTISPALANYNGNYSYADGPKGQFRQQPTEVGSFVPNEFGLYDMHGNVWEWCLDNWPSVLRQAPFSNVARALSGQTKTLRGGSWFYQPTDCRSARRLSYPFHSRTDDVGFRVVCMT